MDDSKYYSLPNDTERNMHATYSWKSVADIDALLDKSDDSDLGHLFALCYLWKGSVLAGEYEPDPKWASLIKFTDDGTEFRNRFCARSEGIPDAYLAFALFRRFAYHEILIDWHTSDASGIEQLFTDELQEQKVLLPYRFGRLLYDRFNDRYEGSRTEHLSSAEVSELLAETPAGVYQVNSFLTGPLGLMCSKEKRFFPPTLKLPLWHCSDTGCRNMHTVELRPADLPIIRLEHQLRDNLEESFGPPSEWRYALTIRYLLAREREAKGLKFYDLPNSDRGRHTGAGTDLSARTHSHHSPREGVAQSLGGTTP